MTTDRQPTCAERITAYQAGRSSDLAALFAIIDNGTGDYEGDHLTDEDAYERLHEFPLAIDVETSVRITFGTGGPADYLTVPVESDGHGGWEISGTARYHFADWFDHADEEATDEMCRYASQLIEVLEDGGRVTQ